MKYFLVVLLFSFSVAFWGQHEWLPEEIAAARTADSCQYFDEVEKEVVMFFNLARLYPQKFKEIELKGYLGTKKYGDYLKNSPWITSLEQTLDTIQPMNALVPDSVLYEHARCFAEEMGNAGTTGHERFNCVKNEKYGECSSFGMDNGKDIVMQMLIDHNIEGLGHRLQSLDPKNKMIGLSVQSHKEWDVCCVINYKRGDLHQK